VSDELHGQELAAYAFDLLDAPGRARVEAHLRTCTECWEELAEYRAVIAVLPRVGLTERAPAGAWQTIEAGIRARDRGTHGALRPGRWFRVGGWQPALSAALAAAVIGLIVWNATLQARVSDSKVELPGLSAASQVVVVELVAAAAGGADGHVIMSQDRRQGGLVIGGLPELAADRSYQIWFVRADQTRVSAGTFGVDSLGQTVTLISVPQPVEGFGGVAITEEPGGGSPTPTGRDLLAGPIYGRNADYQNENPFPGR